MYDIDTLCLGFEKSLVICSPTPSGKNQLYSLDALMEDLEKTKAKVGSFGFWSSASNNFASYYPDITNEDFNPNDETGFVYPTFRGLSEVVIKRGSWDAIDFTKPNVLKKSMDLLTGLTVYPNHDMEVGNELGVIMEVAYQKAYTTDDGLNVPGGILTKLRIDGKSNPKIARGVNLNPPTIHSASVTVEFAWEQSHKDMERDEFYNKLGTYDSEGELVRRVVTNIIRFYEISLVPHGADPFAQKVGEDGKILLPKLAGARSQFSEEIRNKNNGSIFASYSFSNTLRLEEKEEKPVNLNNNSKNQKTMMKKYLLMMAASLALPSPESHSEETLAALIAQALETDKTKVEGFKTQIQNLTTEVSNLKNAQTEFDSLKQFKTDNENLLTELKSFKQEVVTQAVNTYKLAEKENAKEDFITQLSTLKFSELSDKIKPFQKKAGESFSGKCGECGSTNITSQTSMGEGEGEGEKSFKPKSDKEVMESFSLTGIPESSIF